MNKLPNIFPESWTSKLKLKNLSYIEFRNILHFKSTVSKLRQKKDNHTGVTYEKALSDLMKGVSNFNVKKYESVRNLVRSKLLKRGLITDEVYENFKYATDGTVIDIDMGKFANGEPDCVITPSVQYVDFFHELYVNISYSYIVSEETITENMNKMLATIEELQRQHIHIKISLILPISRPDGENDFLSVIPVFSHREFKTAEIMSVVLNNRLLRKFYFAIMEDHYKKSLQEGYGTVVKLPDAVNIGEEFNEVDFFTEIQQHVQGK